MIKTPTGCVYMSLSARRAWIEILLLRVLPFFAAVALRKESVDRNNAMQVIVIVMDTVALRKESVDRNLSALPGKAVTTVALRKESVDRNLSQSFLSYLSMGRSPQGERG